MSSDGFQSRIVKVVSASSNKLPYLTQGCIIYLYKTVVRYSLARSTNVIYFNSGASQASASSALHASRKPGCNMNG